MFYTILVSFAETMKLLRYFVNFKNVKEVASLELVVSNHCKLLCILLFCHVVFKRFIG